MCIFLGVAKYVYLPLVGLGLLFISTKNMTKKEKAILIISTIVLSLTIALLWFKLATSYVDTRDYIEENNVSIIGQIQYAISNPLQFIKVIANDIYASSEKYIYGAVGESLGWLNITVPRITITIFLFIFILSAFLENNERELKTPEKLYTMFIAIGIYALVIIGLYLSWSPVGDKMVCGVQGRYFIPIFILPILCLCKKNNYVKIKHINLIIPILLTLLDLSVIKVIFNFFI